jgi:hypothetical protein
MLNCRIRGRINAQEKNLTTTNQRFVLFVWKQVGFSGIIRDSGVRYASFAGFVVIRISMAFILPAIR